MCKWSFCTNFSQSEKKKSDYLRTDSKKENVRKSTLALMHKPRIAHTHTHTHLHKDYSVNTVHTQTRESTQRVDSKRNSGVFVHWVLKRDDVREAMTPNSFLSVPHLEHPSLRQAHISHLMASVCTQPTHSAQQQQHTAHHNGYHDGQLTATKLHFGNGVMKVSHLHLEREKEETTH